MGLIACLVNHRITTGIFPDLWKHAVVTPDGLIGKLYYTFVLTVLDYCDVVWSPSSAVHSRKFERFHSNFFLLTSDSQGSLRHTLA